MKLEILQDDLLNSLKTVNPFVGNGIMPIDQNVLLQADEFGLTVAASSSNGTIVQKLPCRAKETGGITVPSQFINNYVLTLARGEVVNLSSDDKQLLISQKKRRSKINGVPIDEFPDLPEVDKDNPIQIDGLQNLLKQVLFAVDEDSPVFILTGINLQSNGERIRLSSATGQNGAIIEQYCNCPEFDITVPLFSLQQLLKNETEINLYSGNGRVYFVFNDTVIDSPVLQGNYPDLQPFIDYLKEATGQAKIETKLLLNTLKSAMLFAKEANNRAYLSFDQGRLEVSTPDTEIGHFEDVLGCENENQFREILNCQHLINALSVIQTDFVHIYYISKGKPFIIRDSNDRLFTVSMPFGEK